ncbi:MAG: glycosyltransferase family 2 protein [Phycisphaeraceae bacterium]|nr:glycosyltransferase family 2 protein [Phycisphaeraceae bacterium]
MSRVPVTVVLPVKNEERQLAACLERLRRFHSVMVVDSSSTDRTPQIARDFGARYVNFQWNGQFPKKRNWVLRTQTFETPWVLFLDADEFVSEEFCDELERILATTTHVGFWLVYRNHFMGRPIRHGAKFRKLSLFKIGSGEYERVDEQNWSALDIEVHEHPIVDGTTGEIHAAIDHHDYRGLAHYIAKHNDYSSWEARRYHQLRDEGRLDDPKLTPRQRTKYRMLPKWWCGPAYFIDNYFRRLGLLDGGIGFIFSTMKAIYFWQIWLKIREIDREDQLTKSQAVPKAPASGSSAQRAGK